MKLEQERLEMVKQEGHRGPARALTVVMSAVCGGDDIKVQVTRPSETTPKPGTKRIE
jgi:hypothetical protein